MGTAWRFGYGTNTNTVLRAGWGIFYQRLDDDQMMVAARLNGINQLTYVASQPAFFPVAPPISDIQAVAASFPTVYRISPNLHSPYDMDLVLASSTNCHGL